MSRIAIRGRPALGFLRKLKGPLFVIIPALLAAAAFVLVMRFGAERAAKRQQAAASTAPTPGP